MTTVGLPDNRTHIMPGHAARPCLHGPMDIEWFSVRERAAGRRDHRGTRSQVRFIRSTSAAPFGLRALDPQDWSSSSSLTSANAFHLTSPQPEKQKVAAEGPWDGVRELSLPRHMRALLSRGVPPRHFPESMVAASMSVSAADRACSRGEVSLSEVARATAPSKSTASWLPSR